MEKVSTQFTMSLDGFIAGPNDDIGRLFGWYGKGDTAFKLPGTDRAFKVSRASAEYLREEWSALGAIVTGRHDFDVSDAYGGVSPLGVPMFIVTHRVPQEWVKDGSPFTFVTDGVESALEQAKQVAGDKTVGVGGATIVQQCLRAGWLDEILIDLAPILLGAGTRLFDHFGPDPIDLEVISVVNAPSVTHLKFRVIKS
ncbi:MAG: dihydrofolate reductase family protein [Anaerolineales bacterium]